MDLFCLLYSDERGWHDTSLAKEPLMKSSSRILAVGVLLLLTPTIAAAVTHTVNQVGITFDPAEVTIEVGDTVEWIWSGSSHTVTSGTNLSDPQVGLLFDDPLNSANPIFTYTFLEAGSQDYFCRPHLSAGMTGVVHVITPSAVDDTPGRTAMQLLPNAPNPFNPSTRITFDLSPAGDGAMAVSLRVFDLQGHLVRVLMDESVTASRQTVVWDGRDLHGKASPSGVYVYRLGAGGQTLSRTMTLAK